LAYWYILYPLHRLMFDRMLAAIAVQAQCKQGPRP